MKAVLRLYKVNSKAGQYILKSAVIIFVVCCFLSSSLLNVHATDNLDLDEIYSEQYKLSGAQKLEDELPKEARRSIKNIGIDLKDIKSFTKLTPDKVFNEIFFMIKQQSPIPIKAMCISVSIILLCAVIESMKLSFGERPLSGILSVVSALSICIAIIFPIVETISNAAMVIQCSANFMLVYIPVMAGIMVASGQPVSAASYHMMMVIAGETISQIASRFLVPFLNVFLSVSVVSVLSDKMNLSGICKSIGVIIKWILSFVMTIFVSLLTMQSIVAGSSDNTGTKAVKFALNSFVPIVGGALSDAFSTVQGCVKLLKSGVGAFGVLAAGVIFIPLILECLMWLLSVNVCASIGDIFSLKQISEMLRAVSRVISTILAIVLCCMTILTISTVLVLIVGGGLS